jgi:regulator of nonsense transcripts 2
MNTTASERPSAEDVATIEERKRQEEEQKRLEAERKAAEANRKAQEKQSTELQEKIQAALETLEAIVESTKQRRESRELFAAESLVEARKTFEASKKSLKSDLKKCTAFVKKVKSGSAWSMRPHELTKDVATLNLSRYVEEVAAAVTESRWKVADIPVVMALCRAMHERYADFLPTLVPALWSTINSKVTEETAKLRRLYARLMTEFVMNGMGSETKHLVKLVAEASGASDGSYAVTDASIVVSFAKTAGFEVFGTRPKSIQGAIDLLNYEVERAVAAEKSELGTEAGNVSAPVMPTALRENALAILPQVEQALEARAVGPKVSEVLLTHCMGTYDTLSKSLVTTHDKLQKLEKRCEQDRLLAGGLSDAREKGLSDARKLLDSLLKSVETLSDILVQTVPELTDEKGEDEHEKGVGLELWTKEGQDGEGADFGPFDDEETRAFYCDIPDLLSTIPPALLNMSTEEIELKRSENAKKYGDGSEGASEMAESDSSEIVPSSEADLEADEAEEVEGTEEEMDVDTGTNEGSSIPGKFAICIDSSSIFLSVQVARTRKTRTLPTIGSWYSWNRNFRNAAGESRSMSLLKSFA